MTLMMTLIDPPPAIVTRAAGAGRIAFDQAAFLKFIVDAARFDAILWA
jgi:hypothetical protein